LKIGVIALSFAKYSEKKEPNPVNIKLANVVESIVDDIEAFGDDTFVVAQWEIARQLEWDNRPAQLVVTLWDASIKDGGRRYLDSADVVRKAFTFFREQGITDVVIVANPFLHLSAVRKMVENAGFTVIRDHKVPPVGFDRSADNLQWWCRGPFQLVAYLVLQVFGKLTRQNLHGFGERQS
jgi:hypothetical protein